MQDRTLRVLRLDRTVFKEIAASGSATWEACAIVLVVAGASAVGSGLSAALSTGLAPEQPQTAVLGAIAGAVVQWVVWSALVWFIGTSVFDAQASPLAMVRVLGFAQLPKLLATLAFVPVVGVVAPIVGQVLALRTGFVAGQQTLGLAPKKTAATYLLSFTIAVVLAGFVRDWITNVGLWQALIGP